MSLERWVLMLAGAGVAALLLMLLVAAGAMWEKWLVHRERITAARGVTEVMRAGRAAAESTPWSPEDLLRRAGRGG